MGTAASQLPAEVPGGPDIKARPLLYSDGAKVVSLRSRHSITCYFRNKSSHSFTLMWVDYSGGEVPYGILRPGQEKQIFTYLTHPWTFRSRYYGPGQLLTEGREVYFPNATKLEVDVIEATLFHVWTIRTHQELFSSFGPFNAQIKALLLAHRHLSHPPGTTASIAATTTALHNTNTKTSSKTNAVTTTSHARADSGTLVTWAGRLASPMSTDTSSGACTAHSSPRHVPIPGIASSWEIGAPNSDNVKTPAPKPSPSIFDRLRGSISGTSSRSASPEEGQQNSPGNCMLLHALLRGLKRRKDNSPPPTPPAINTNVTASMSVIRAVALPVRRSLFTPTSEMAQLQQSKSDLGVLPLDVLLCVIPYFAPAVPVVAQIHKHDMMLHPPGMSEADALVLLALEEMFEGQVGGEGGEEAEGEEGEEGEDEEAPQIPL